MTALDSSLRAYDLETTRERWSLGGEYDGASGWRTELHYTHETRDGRRLIGSNFITTSSQLPGPVDFMTDQIDWSAHYQTARGTVGVSYFGSFFSNKQGDLAWENPFSAIAPGADEGRSALAPDNNYNQLALNLGYELGPAWRVSLNATMGRGKQDDEFLAVHDKSVDRDHAVAARGAGRRRRHPARGPAALRRSRATGHLARGAAGEAELPVLRARQWNAAGRLQLLSKATAFLPGWQRTCLWIPAPEAVLDGRL